MTNEDINSLFTKIDKMVEEARNNFSQLHEDSETTYKMVEEIYRSVGKLLDETHLLRLSIQGTIKTVQKEMSSTQDSVEDTVEDAVKEIKQEIAPKTKIIVKEPIGLLKWLLRR